MFICLCIDMFMYKYICMYTLHVWKCMYEYVYVVVCFTLVKKLKLNSVRSKYYILHLFKLFTVSCVLFSIYGRQIHISP